MQNFLIACIGYLFSFSDTNGFSIPIIPQCLVSAYSHDNVTLCLQRGVSAECIVEPTHSRYRKIHQSIDLLLENNVKQYPAKVNHFISTDRLYLNASPYTFCDLDPINNIDKDGNSPVCVLPSVFEIELGSLPRFISGQAGLQLKFWQMHYVKVSNQKISFYADEIDDNNLISRLPMTQVKLAKKINTARRTLEFHSDQLTAEYTQTLNQFKRRFLHVKNWNFDKSGNIPLEKYYIENYPVDKPFMDKLSRLSSNSLSRTSVPIALVPRLPKIASTSTGLNTASTSGANADGGFDGALYHTGPETSAQGNPAIASNSRAVAQPSMAPATVSTTSSIFDDSQPQSSQAATTPQPTHPLELDDFLKMDRQQLNQYSTTESELTLWEALYE